MSEGPVFYQDSINKNAVVVLSCLARIVNEIFLEMAKGHQFSPEMRVEVGNAVALIMRATAPPQCPVGPSKKVVDEAKKGE
jgi:hypothetical protein